MHAGWPFLEEMIALLYAHPSVHVDVGVLDWTQPREEFHRYLRRLVEAGYGKRIMFGSDQMVWPEAIEMAVATIQSAEYLTPEQRSDIFYHNAARFLRLEPATRVAPEGAMEDPAPPVEHRRRLRGQCGRLRWSSSRLWSRARGASRASRSFSKRPSEDVGQHEVQHCE